MSGNKSITRQDCDSRCMDMERKARRRTQLKNVWFNTQVATLPFVLAIYTHAQLLTIIPSNME